MAIPDLWIKILKHVRDEDWNINDIVRALENRRQCKKIRAFNSTVQPAVTDIRRAMSHTQSRTTRL